MNHNYTVGVKANVIDSATDDHGYSVVNILNKDYSIAQTKLGSSVPNWKRKIAMHEDASSSYELWISRLTFSNAESSARFHYGPPTNITNGRWNEQGPLAGIAPFFQPTGQPEPGWGVLSVRARNLLNVKFLNKLREVTNSFNGGEFLGEIRETLNGIRHPAEALRKGFSSYLFTLKKRRSGLKRGLSLKERTRAVNRMVAGTYLEWKFGVTPTLNDIHDAGLAYNDLFDDLANLGPMTQVVAKIDDSVVDKGWGRQLFRPGNFWHVWTDTNPLRKVSGRMVGCVDRSVNQPVRFDTRLGISPRDFVPTCWNLLPGSFVADYFVNIGDCLSAAGTSTCGLKVLVLTTRTKRLYEAQAQMDKTMTLAALAGANVTVDSLTGSISHMKYETSYWVREVLAPLDDLWVIPVISLPTSPTRWINLAALSAQVAETKYAIRP